MKNKKFSPDGSLKNNSILYYIMSTAFVVK
jgi:hypothetical protein